MPSTFTAIRGINYSAGVTRKPKTKNPAITGVSCFKIPSHFPKEKEVAHQQFRCSGIQSNCGKCEAEIKIQYFSDDSVHVYYNNVPHNQEFKIRPSTNVKECFLLVEEYFHVEDKGYVSLQAREIENFLRAK